MDPYSMITYILCGVNLFIAFILGTLLLMSVAMMFGGGSKDDLVNVKWMLLLVARVVAIPLACGLLPLWLVWRDQTWALIVAGAPTVAFWVLMVGSKLLRWR